VVLKRREVVELNYLPDKTMRRRKTTWGTTTGKERERAGWKTWSEVYITLGFTLINLP